MGPFMFFPMAGFFSDTAQAIFNQKLIRQWMPNMAITFSCELSNEGVFADPPVHIHRHKASLVLHRLADGLAGLGQKFNSGKNTFFKWISQGIFEADLLGSAIGFLTKNPCFN